MEAVPRPASRGVQIEEIVVIVRARIGGCNQAIYMICSQSGRDGCGGGNAGRIGRSGWPRIV